MYMKKERQSKQIFTIAIFILAVFSTFLLGLSQRVSQSAFPNIKITIIVIIASIIGFFFVRKKTDKTVFFVVALFGLTSAVVTPVLGTPDEQVHFSRSLHIAHGDINLENDEKKVLVYKDYYEVFDNFKKPIVDTNLLVKKDSDDLVHFKKGEVDYRQTNAYWFLGYIPQSLGLIIGKSFNFSVGATYILGRIFNALAYAFLLYVAVKLSGKYKQIFTFFGMIPMNIFLAASYNQDGVSLGLIYITIAMFLKMYDQTDKISLKQILTYTALCIGIATTKLPYILLICLPTFITKDKFSKRVKGFAYFSILFVFTFTLIWFKLYQQVKGVVIIQNVNPTEQLKFMLSHPQKGLRAVLTEFFSSLYKSDMVFNFGWLDFPIKELYFYFIVSTIIVSINNVKGKVFKIWQQISISMISAGIIGLIVLSMYLTWTPVGESIVQGVQGRYYLGVYLLLLILLTNLPEKYTFKEKLTDEFVFKISKLGMVMFLVFSLAHYY